MPGKPAPSSKQREQEFRRLGPPPITAPPGATASGNGQAPKLDRATRKKLWREYARWLWPYRGSLAGVLLLALLVTGLDLVWPLAVRQVINSVLVPDGAGIRRLQWLGLVTLGLILLKQSVDSFRSYRVSVLNSKITFKLRRRLFGKLMQLALGQIADMKTGGIVSRLSGDVDSVGGLVQMAIISPAVAIIRVMLTVLILLWLSWQLSVAALVALPFMGVASYLYIRKVRPIYRSIREDMSGIDGRVGETFGGIRVVRAFRREKREEKTYALGHHTAIRKLLFATRIELILEAVWGLLIPTTSLLLVWYGGALVLKGRATVGDIFVFQIYAVLLLQPIWMIVQSVSALQKSLAAMERIFGVLDTPPDKPDAPDAGFAPRRVETFEFDHVSFEYRPDIAVIDDFNLSVTGGTTVALVGPSGAGKTTLTDLVARFYDPTRGALRLNGTDLRKIKLRSYRSLLAVVQQDTFLFDGSVRENIAYGLRDATDDEVVDAARRANAHQFIEQLPDRYDTVIGERGFKLSGGQRQRISIARAVLADPQILILDEATSNLDTESEQLIQASLAELYKNRTTFVIAHRLSTVTHADKIVVLDEGKMVETGTHDRLLERRGLYFDMVERQRRSMETLPALA
ncbi:MAG: ABC transporter ATP-binding protein [Tepidisphaeraceae bacterium]